MSKSKVEEILASLSFIVAFTAHGAGMPDWVTGVFIAKGFLDWLCACIEGTRETMKRPEHFPYHTTVMWSEEDKAYKAMVSDIPNCMAFGSTGHAALIESWKAADAMLEALKDAGKPIPVPSK